MSRAKELEKALIEAIGVEETEQLFCKIINLARSKPDKARKNLKILNGFL